MAASTIGAAWNKKTTTTTPGTQQQTQQRKKGRSTCGIFGWQWKKNNLPTIEKRTLIAVALGWQNEARGTDSYGWHDERSREICKGTGRIGPHAMSMAALTSVVGHTRHATTGTKTKDNAHPFEIGKIVGAHNGIIHNHEELNKERKAAGLEEWTVDSQHIFDALNNGSGIDHLRGYGAIEWTNRDNPGVIFLCRISASGDLAVAMTQFGVVWSSDKGHLEETLIVSNVKYQIMECKDNKVYFAEDGKYFVSEEKLEVGAWAMQAQSYATTPYGSRLFQSGLEDAETDWKRSVVKTLFGGSDDKRPFTGLSKKDRKRLIKERNERLRTSQGKSSSGAKYKDLCKCGARAWENDPHFKWCDQYKPVSLSRVDLGMCDECGFYQVGGAPTHTTWCSTKKSITALSTSAEEPRVKQTFDSKINGLEILGMMDGTRWCCTLCKSTPNPDDQHCPNGHGRVLGQLSTGRTSGQTHGP